jgi:hypothetical protein
MLEVLQAVDAEVQQLGAVWEGVADELLGGQRDQDLPAVGGGHEARDAVDGAADVVAVRDLGQAGVDGNTHAQRLEARGNLVPQGRIEPR